LPDTVRKRKQDGIVPILDPLFTCNQFRVFWGPRKLRIEKNLTIARKKKFNERDRYEDLATNVSSFWFFNRTFGPKFLNFQVPIFSHKLK